MSDSDDTDVLLLIPPDLFIVPPTESDDELVSTATKPGVVSEIIEHVQSLETRISAIESRDNSFEIIPTSRHNLPHVQHCVSQTSLFVKSPSKPRRCSSLPITPCSYSVKNTNAMRNEESFDDRFNIQLPFKSNSSGFWDKHEELTSLSDPSPLKTPSRRAARTLHASLKKDNKLHDIYRNTSNRAHTRRSLFSSSSSRKSTENIAPEIKEVEDMNLVEVEQMLREIEMTEQELSQKTNLSKAEAAGLQGNESNKPYTDPYLKYSKDKTSSADKLGDLYLSNDDSTQYADPEKLISDFKVWRSNDDDNSRFKTALDKSHSSKNPDNGQYTSVYHDYTRNTCGSELGMSYTSNNDVKYSGTSKYPEVASDLFGSLNNTSKANGSEPIDSVDLFSECHGKNNVEDELKMNYFKKKSNTNGDSCLLKSQRLLALSDFWEHDDTKSQEEMLRIKVEEEKLRREHCEYVIQELQKKLLEQQEKVAVAIKIDNKKNSVIAHFQGSWEKLKQKYQNLESEYNSTQCALKTVSEKHQYDISDMQSKISKCQGELSQALDLAAGYKEKSDILVKEKVDLVKTHVDELENYKTLIQQKEQICEQIRDDYNKLLEKNVQLDELFRSIQQDLSKERMKNSEVRNEMTAIHKALDTCGAELTVLRQEKENLQIKLKEETNKCHNLEQNKLALLAAIDDAKKAEKQTKDDMNILVEQQEKVRCELRDVYQKQLDEVVKAKQEEFQTQLDSAEVAFQTELDTRQRAIAECAARKIKTVIDKHQLEINLLEEKHKEEKRLYELQLAQVAQKTSMLEAQLNSQKASKNQLVEQLHSVMQRQWQQALRIISGGNGENLASFQNINVDKFFDLKNSINNDVLINNCTKGYQGPVRLAAYSGNGGESRGAKSREDRVESLITLTSNDEIPTNTKKDGKNDLRGYIQMILDMQQSSDDILKTRLTDSTVTPPPVYREVPKKHYTKKELSIMSEDSVTWHPISEASGADTSEYIAVPQKLGRDQQKIKPPWK